jgi:hypothetical protein
VGTWAASQLPVFCKKSNIRDKSPLKEKTGIEKNPFYHFMKLIEPLNRKYATQPQII